MEEVADPCRREGRDRNVHMYRGSALTATPPARFPVYSYEVWMYVLLVVEPWERERE